MSRKKRKDGLESKVIPFRLPKGKIGKYIPICTYNCHQGIILREYVCLSRNCIHYQRAYVGKENGSK